MDFHSISSSLADSKGVPLHIVSPDGLPLYAEDLGDGKWNLTTKKTEFPCRFFMVGQDSEKFRQRKAKMYIEAVKTSRKKKNFDEAEHEMLETVAAGVVGWENIVWTGNVLFDYDEDNLIEFLDAYRPAFDQANTFIMDRSNFFSTASMG